MPYGKKYIGSESDITRNIKDNWLKNDQGVSAWDNWLNHTKREAEQTLISGMKDITRSRLDMSEQHFGHGQRALHSMNTPPMTAGQKYEAGKNIRADYLSAYREHQAGAIQAKEQFAGAVAENLYAQKTEMSGMIQEQAKQIQNFMKAAQEFSGLTHRDMEERRYVETVKGEDGNIHHQYTEKGRMFFDKLLRGGKQDDEGNIIYFSEDFLGMDDRFEELYWQYTADPSLFHWGGYNLDPHTGMFDINNYSEELQNRDRTLQQYGIDMFSNQGIEITRGSGSLSAQVKEINKQMGDPLGSGSSGNQHRRVTQAIGAYNKGDLKDGDIIDLNYGMGTGLFLILDGKFYKVDDNLTPTVRIKNRRIGSNDYDIVRPDEKWAPILGVTPNARSSSGGGGSPGGR